ncbi:MAG: hypothetical protein H6841_03385 [Planctomycetes bacterium]|nr:hypothetical protein [Planctomycetota bacterium]MCB9934162.1 hypothetical protein [Planctomycetota bacterium]
METAAYPDHRVQVRHGVHYPQELYTENRVLLRRLRVESDGRGMRLSGEVLTNLFAESPPGEPALPVGPLLGWKLEIALFQNDAMVDTHLPGEVPHLPSLKSSEPGRAVPGQQATITVTELHHVYGLGRFSLPWLEKPLAPGVYFIVVGLNFSSQRPVLRDALCWCPNLYGVHVEEVRDEHTLEMKEKRRPVYGHPELHARAYEDLLAQGELVDSALIEVGQVLEGGKVSLRGPGQAEPNLHIRDGYLRRIDELSSAESQFQSWNEWWQQEKRKDEGNLRTEYMRLWRIFDEAIQARGGPLSPAERLISEQAALAEPQVLKQIRAFQDRLRFRCWVLLDGVLLYAGWHSVNRPGYDTWEAIKKQKYQPHQPPQPEPKSVRPNTVRDVWRERRELWRYFPDEIRDIAFDYLRRKEETEDFHAERFTKLDAKTIRFDAAKWSTMRAEFLAGFLAQTDEHIAGLDTTGEYAVQVWPTARQQIVDARDAALLLPFAWEWYIRTEQHNEPGADVAAGWGEHSMLLPEHLRSELATQAARPPGRIKDEFDLGYRGAYDQLQTYEFMNRRRRAIDAGLPLPGQD